MPHTSVLRLVEQGRLGDAVALIEVASTPSLADLVIRAFLEGLVGNFERASASASRLLDRHLTNVQRGLCLETTARAAAPLEAMRLLRTAAELMSSAHEPVELARFSVRYCRAVLNLVGVEAAYVELPRVRKTVLRAGDVHAAIDLHLLTAETEAKRNKRVRSDAHLRVAATLLKDTHNVFQWARLEQIRSNLAALSSDFRAALVAAHKCARYATEAGWMTCLGGALGNIGQFKLALGDIAGATEFVGRGKSCPHNSKITELAAKDTELQILMAQDSELAYAYAEELWDKDFTGDWRHSYYGLWHHLTRSRLFLARGEFAAAHELVRMAMPYVDRTADGHLLAAMNLRAAEIEAVVGHSNLSAEFLWKVYSACDELPLEMLAELQKVTGQVSRLAGSSDAWTFFERADRLLESAGLEVARRELAKISQSTVHTRPQGIIHSESSTTAEPCRVVHRLSALVYLAGNPTQFGLELIRLVQEVAAAKAATLTVVKHNGSSQTVASFGDESVRPNSPHSIQIELGSDGEHEISLWVLSPQDGESLVSLAALQHLVRSALDLHVARTKFREAAPLWPDGIPEQQLGMIIGAENMIELVAIARRLATSNITVLISGETGTGKELLARAVHDGSPRKEKSFIPFNCSAVPRDMLDAQLFGYRRGAFTGAHDAFQGVIRAAAGGTLFLDEIGEITPEVQPKLLRFLESGEIHPLGEPKPLVIDVRIVAATNANLEQLVADGRFREDLFYRLNVVRLEVPPLRERREEIPLLVQHYLERCSRESQKTGLRLAEETMEYLILYKWPGNVRQLANEMRRLVALAESGAVLMPEHLSPDIAASRRTLPASERDLAPTEFVVRMDQPMSAAIEHLERSMIQYAFKLSHGVEEAAQILGLSRKGLYLKRQRLGILDQVHATDHVSAPKPTTALLPPESRA